MHRRPILLLSALVMGAVLLVSPLAASATPPAVPAAPSAAGVVELPVGDVAAADPAADIPDFVGSDTSRFVIEPTRASTGASVTCTYRFEFGGVAEDTYSAAEWNTGRVVLDFEAQDVVPYWFGTFYGVECWAQDGDWFLEWPLEAVARAGEAVTLRQGDPATASLTRYEADSVPPVAHPGDTVRITGAPGTWPLAAEATRTAAHIIIHNGGFLDEAVILPGYVVAPDGSVLTFVIPDGSALRLLDLDLPTPVRVMMFADHGSAGAELVRWSGALTISTQVASTTTASTALPIGLSFLRTTVRATVSAPTDSAPAGLVTFAVDGRTVATVRLTASAGGRASVRLPLLERGSHRITVAYSGSEGIAPSASPAVPLWILF